MIDRRKKKRDTKERRHPLRTKARLTPTGPALERRKEKRTGRARLTVQLPDEIVERLRNAVYWTPKLTLAGVVEQCIIETVDRMESERGAKFPARKRPLRAGRPRKE